MNVFSSVFASGSAGVSRELGALEVGEHVRLALAADGARTPVDIERVDGVDALAERRPTHGDTAGDGVRVGDDRDVGDPRHRLHLREVAHPGPPLIVGGRQSIVGSASGMCRSIANVLRPVTMSTASMRAAASRSADFEAGFSCASTRVVSVTAASAASSAYEACAARS